MNISKTINHNCDDFNFAALFKVFKQAGGHMTFNAVKDWYCAYYLMAPDNIHDYVKDISYLLVKYVERHEFMTIFNLYERLNPQNWLANKFTDLDEETNNKYHYRVIAEICGTMTMTEATKIPGYMFTDGTV